MHDYYDYYDGESDPTADVINSITNVVRWLCYFVYRKGIILGYYVQEVRFMLY